MLMHEEADRGDAGVSGCAIIRIERIEDWQVLADRDLRESRAVLLVRGKGVLLDVRSDDRLE